MTHTNKNGFSNLGNTCYLNACLQLLFNINEFNTYFVEKSFLNELNTHLKNNKFKDKKENAFVHQYYGLLRDYFSVDKKLLTPRNLLQSILQLNTDFELGEQHDSQEMLIFILDTLHESLNYEVDVNFEGTPQNKTDKLVIESIDELSKILKKKYSIVNELFYGMYYNTFVSIEEDTTGKFISKKWEHFNNLTLQFDGSHLVENLDLYFKDEIMDTEMEEESTGKKYKVKKITKIINSPKYLFITLKKYDIRGKKNKNNYTFPIEKFDFSKYCDGYDKYDCNYKLIGAICHSGSIDFGHYISIIKKGEKWYVFNDDNVSEINIESQKNMLFKNGYVLLYQKI